MKLNQLDGLVAFCKVAEHRGFTAAAAALEVSPSALSQAIRTLESRLGVRLLNRTTRSVSLTEAGEAYLSRVGPALGDVLEAGEQLACAAGPAIGPVADQCGANLASPWSCSRCLPGFLKAYPDVQIELTTDEGYVDIVERGFDAGIRMGESVQKDMVAVPLGGPVSVAIVGSPDYFKRHPVPRHPSDLVHHNCVRFRFSGSGAIYKWELDGRRTASSSTRSAAASRSATRCSSVEAALEGSGWRTPSSSSRFHTFGPRKLKRVSDQLLASVSGVLPLLPQPAPAAFQAEGVRGVRAHIANGGR